MTEVNLAEVTKGGSINNLSGKERGVAARQIFKIDQFDSEDGVIDVIVPESMDVITPSYFQGLFSQSIAKLGGEEAFKNHYRFHATAEVMKWINRGIDRCTMKRSALG